jgi:hypothetical protein
MNDLLVTNLAASDQRLLFYLDQDDEMMFDTVERLRSYTTALLDASITPAVLVAKWSGWFDLVPAFVVAYGTEELQRAKEGADFLREHDVVELTEGDRTFLRALALRFDMYPDIRRTGR